MKKIAIALVLIPLICNASTAQDPMKIGNVYIVGNTVTQDRIIREACRLDPGEFLRAAEVRNAEARLAALGLFEVSKGCRPTITVVEDDDSVFKDLVVNVKEKPTSSWRVALCLTPWAGPTLGVVWEERNFDANRWPESWEDIVEGRAFRGGGERIRLDAAALTPTNCVVIFSQLCAAIGR